MPMPPCTCCAVRRPARRASAAQNFAIAASRPGGRPWSSSHAACHVVHADGLDVDEGVGHPLLHRLEAADRPAELLAFGGVDGRDAQRALGDAELDRAQTRPARGHAAIHERCRAVPAQPIGCGCTVEEYVAVRFAVGRSSTGRDLDAVRRPRRRRKTADVVAVERGRDEDGARELGRGHQLLDAVEAPAVAVAASGGRRRGRVGAARLRQTRVEYREPSTTPGRYRCAVLVGAVAGDRCRRRAAAWRRRAPARRVQPHLGEQQRKLHKAVTAAADASRAARCRAGRRRPTHATARRRNARSPPSSSVRRSGVARCSKSSTRDLGDRLLLFGEGEVHGQPTAPAGTDAAQGLCRRACRKSRRTPRRACRLSTSAGAISRRLDTSRTPSSSSTSATM